MPRPSSLILMACLAAASAACASTERVEPSPEPFDLYFPQRPPPTGPHVSMTAVLGGVLLVADGCLWIDVGGERYLVVWPSSYVVRPIGGLVRINDRDGSAVATQGAHVTVGGGEVPVRDKAEAQAAVGELTGTTIPPECDVNFIWNANSVIPPG